MVKKSQEEKAKADEEKRVRAAELAERKAKTAELERKRKEREERERRLKADEDASKKRKLAASTNASATADKNGAPEPKRFASSSSSTNNPTQQPKQLVSKLSKSNLAASAGLSGLPPKPVVPSFRHLPPSSSSSNAVQRPSNAPTSNNAPSASTSTIRVIPAMGPPIRPSDMNKTLGHGHANRASQAPSGPSSSSNSAASILLLAQQRQALQSHIASQNIQPSDAAESEAIELPDIKSEYSDSDDEDRPNKGASLPAWAQSPEIRSALREQESFNPDDVFGPMKPLSMEEVFRARAGKFRARSSSANWGGQDRLTEREEMEYARRMGFK